MSSNAGRNHTGMQSVLGRKGPFNRQLYPYVDYVRSKRSAYLIVRFDFSGFRNRYLMLVYNFEYGFSYYTSIDGLRIYHRVKDNDPDEFGIGSAVPVGWLSVGQELSSIGSSCGLGSKFSKSSGSKCIVVNIFGDTVSCKLPSGAIKSFYKDTRCIFGVVSENLYEFTRSRVKAGYNIRRGFKQKVRGVAKNPVDHPHGGGEGRKSPPAAHRSPWGWITSL